MLLYYLKYQFNNMIKQYKYFWKPELDDKIFDGVHNYLSQYKLKYLGLGGTCISFIDNSDIIYKICLKQNNDILKSADIFMHHCNTLIKNGVSILSPIDIVYDDEHFLVYRQPKCNPLTEVNTKILVEILKNLKAMLLSMYRLTDIYFRNFGIYQNKIVIYDYHDYKDFFEKDYTYIVHLVQTFNLYYNKNIYKKINLDIEEIIQDDFCKNHFDFNPSLSDFFKNLYNWNFDKAIKHIDTMVEDFSDALVYDIYDYQKISIDRNGIISLHIHTLDKFNLLKSILPYLPEKFSVIDCGCSIGGIGGKIAQLYPKSNIVLNNITKNELDTAKSMFSKLCLNNIVYDDTNIMSYDKVHDVTLFYALLHHLLRDMTFNELIEKIYKMTNIYSVIELPFYGDVLLAKVVKHGNLKYENTYKYLENTNNFMSEISKYFEIIDSKKIDYGTDDLNRYGFVLRKKMTLH